VVRILLGTLLLFQSLFLDSPQPSGLDPLSEVAYEYGPLVMIPLAGMLALGFRTRMVMVLAWLVYTIPVRGELLSGRGVEMGYYILSLALFWCMFLPMDRHLTVSSRGVSTTPVRYLSVASGALLFQIFIIYFSAGLFKDIGEWVIHGTAMESVLSSPKYETALGTALLGYPFMLRVASVTTFLIEVVGSLLVILPGKTLPTRRLVLVPVFIALHVGIAATMGLGLFPYVMIALWLLFLPPTFWNRVWGWFGVTPRTILPTIDRSRWRNGIAGLAVAIATVSNLIVWGYYRQRDSMPAFFDWFQDLAITLVLFQRFLMFNVPSMV
jgi:hypothetical protein